MGRPRWCTWAAGSVTRSARGRCWTAPTPVSTDGRTHVLLPVGALVRRADAAVVIGAALVAKAAGWGHRRIAVWLDRPASTVRGWLRRFAARAGPLRAAFTTLLCELDPDPPVPEPAGSQVADAVEAIIAAAGAVGRRRGLVLVAGDRKSTRLNSSHITISYAVFCLKKKKKLGGSHCPSAITGNTR